MDKTPLRSRINDTIREIKDAWHSPKGKEIFTFLCFVVLAASIWFFLSISEDRERTIQIPIELTDIPEETVLLQDMPPYVEARIRDKGPVILSYNIKTPPPIKIDFARHDNKKDAIVISNNALIEYARRELKATTSILDFAPDSIRIGYTHDHGKRVPLRTQAHITTSPHSTLSDSIYTTPDSVTIYGKSAQLMDITEAFTEEIVLNNLTDTTTLKTPIRNIPGTRIIPDSATVVIPVEEYTTKSISVPIVVGNIPQGYTIMTFPSHVTLTCMIPMSKYSETISEKFLIGNTFEEMQNSSGSFGAVLVIHAPEYVRNIMLSQDSVEYIVNENITSLPQ